MSELLDPPSAVAVGKCLTARLWKPSLGSLDPEGYHPMPCAWEDFTKSDLVAMLEDFNAEAGYDSRTNRHRSVPVMHFRSLPPEEQLRRVQAAQYPVEVPA